MCSGRATMASNFSALTLTLAFLFFFHLAALHISAATGVEPVVVIEDGYTVTTVIDGHKLGINPQTVMLKPGSSDLVVLDYSGGAFFTVPFPVSEGTVINRLSGTGDVGYVDGEPGSVRFNKPRSFAVDSKGNVYVADRNNNVIRKINTSGTTTTIAGVNKRTGRHDGPVKNATFSNDFELVFVPEKCALLVSDHGNQLVRQIDLKAEDCRRDSGGSANGVSGVLVWSAAVGLACMVGFVVGLVARPYIITRDGMRTGLFSRTWKLCLINLGKLVQILCFVVRSAIANFSLVCLLLERLFLSSLSHLSLVRTDYLGPQTQALSKEQISLLDNDKVGRDSSSSDSSSEMTMMSKKYANQLKDLVSFDGSLDFTNPMGTKMNEEGEEIDEFRLGSEVVLSDCCGTDKVDKMMKTNLMHFAQVAEETTLVDGRSGLVKRR